MKDVITAKGWNSRDVSAELSGWRMFYGDTVPRRN